MSGRRWIFTLLAAVSISATGCQVDGGATKLWNPFARADKTDVMEDGQLPKFVRRATEDEKPSQIEAPVAESRVDALLAEGQRALQENRIPEARQAYHEVLQLIPDDPTAHHGLAMVADLTEQWTEADDHYRQALQSRPRDANLLCDMGYSYLLQNRYSEASSYLSQAIQVNPNHEYAHSNLALLDLRQGNREAARQRLMQRYENPAKVAEILAAFESQTASKAATSLAASAPPIPENASFEEIRELANRERMAAEQRRAALNIPTDHNVTTLPVVPASHTHVAAQDGAADLLATGQQPQRFSGTNIVPAVAGTQATGSYPSGNMAPAYDVRSTGVPLLNSVPPQLGSSPGIASQASPLIGPRDMHLASANTGTIVGAWNSSLLPPQNQLPSQSPNTNLQDPTNPSQTSFSSQLPVSANATAPVTANTTLGSGRLIAVRPSGAFQPPVQGVSYGQPFGFGQPPVESASYQNNGNVVAPGGTISDRNASAGNTNGPSAANLLDQKNLTAGQQDPNVGQNNGYVQVDGLNAGPGSLFPVGQGVGHEAGTLLMENVNPPGSNAMINGAMYGQPVSTLPAQEWMMQQQLKIQQLNAQQQPPNQNGQGYSGQGYSTSQTSGNSGTSGVPHENTATTTAPRPSNLAPPVNPLASYENQLRQLDNQYNNTLKQLDRNASATVPRAQY